MPIPDNTNVCKGSSASLKTPGLAGEATEANITGKCGEILNPHTPYVCVLDKHGPEIEHHFAAAPTAPEGGRARKEALTNGSHTGQSFFEAEKL